GVVPEFQGRYVVGSRCADEVDAAAHEMPGVVVSFPGDVHLTTGGVVADVDCLIGQWLIRVDGTIALRPGEIDRRIIVMRVDPLRGISNTVELDLERHGRMEQHRRRSL